MSSHEDLDFLLLYVVTLRAFCAAAGVEVPMLPRPEALLRPEEPLNEEEATVLA